MRIRRITSHEEENNGHGNGPNGSGGGVGASNDAATPNNDEQPSIRIRDRFLLEALSTILNLNTQRVYFLITTDFFLRKKLFPCKK
jgi:hypothetical protein